MNASSYSLSHKNYLKYNTFTLIEIFNYGEIHNQTDKTDGRGC